MFKAISNLAGVLIVLAAVVVLAAVAVNRNVSARDIKDGAGKAAGKAARGAEYLRDRIGGLPSEPGDQGDGRATDPVARSIGSQGSGAGAAGGAAGGRRADELDELIERVKKDAGTPGGARGGSPAGARPAPQAAGTPQGAGSAAGASGTSGGQGSPGAAGDVQGTHVVQPGETLYRIAADSYGDGKEWKRIADANGISDASKLKVGMKLVIPPKAAAEGR